MDAALWPHDMTARNFTHHCVVCLASCCIAAIYRAFRTQLPNFSVVHLCCSSLSEYYCYCCSTFRRRKVSPLTRTKPHDFSIIQPVPEPLYRLSYRDSSTVHGPLKFKAYNCAPGVKSKLQKVSAHGVTWFRILTTFFKNSLGGGGGRLWHLTPSQTHDRNFISFPTLRFAWPVPWEVFFIFSVYNLKKRAECLKRGPKPAVNYQ